MRLSLSDPEDDAPPYPDCEAAKLLSQTSCPYLILRTPRSVICLCAAAPSTIVVVVVVVCKDPSLSTVVAATAADGGFLNAYKTTRIVATR